VAAIQLVGFAVLLVGTFFTIRHNQQVRKIEQYSRAGDLLASNRPSVRVAGVYAFGQLGRASRHDHRTVTNLLAAYVRAEAPKKSKQGADPSQTPADIQSVVTVLAERKVKYDPKDRFRIGLSHTDLRRARFSKAPFDKAHFRHSSLRGAVARKAHLRHADLDEADLTKAKLNGAHMEHAKLTKANLTWADLTEADLSDANLTGATLIAADLTDATLHRARLPEATLMADAVVTESQLKAARGWTKQHTEVTFKTREDRERSDGRSQQKRRDSGMTDASSSDRT
jgi:uncharacterized protein YjbI with pentapeptide repeats